MLGPCHPLRYRAVDWKRLLPLPYHFSFLSLLENSRSRQLRGRKNHYLEQGQQLDGSLRISGISWPECFSPGVSERACLPSSSTFQFSSLDLQDSWGGWTLPSGCTLYLPALVTRAFRKRVVERSKIQWIYIFNCSAPFCHIHIIFPLANGFGHEQFCKCVQFKIAIQLEVEAKASNSCSKLVKLYGCWSRINDFHCVNNKRILACFIAHVAPVGRVIRYKSQTSSKTKCPKL